MRELRCRGGRRVLLVGGVMLVVGSGILLAFASHPARANGTETTTAPVPTTAVVPIPDPAPKTTAKATPAPKAATPKPTYHPPATPPTPAIHVPSASVRGSAASTPKSQQTPKPQKAHKRRKHPAVKRGVAPPAAAATTLVPPAAAMRTVPMPAKVGLASAPVDRTALTSPATGGNAAGILLLAGFLLGALLVTVATVVPASAARFPLPGGRAVIEHHMDLTILGIALAVLTGLVYALETVGR